MTANEAHVRAAMEAAQADGYLVDRGLFDRRDAVRTIEAVRYAIAAEHAECICQRVEATAEVDGVLTIWIGGVQYRSAAEVRADLRAMAARCWMLRQVARESDTALFSAAEAYSREADRADANGRFADTVKAERDAARADLATAQATLAAVWALTTATTREAGIEVPTYWVSVPDLRRALGDELGEAGDG